MRLKVALSIMTVLVMSSCSFDSNKLMPGFMKKSAGHSVDSYTIKTGKKEFYVIRDGVTFTDGSYITPDGEGTIILPKGYYFVNSSGGRILAANRHGDIIVLKSNGEEIARTKLEAPLVSGVTFSGGIAYLLQGNRFGIYDPFNNRIVFQKQFKGGSVVDNRLANPIVAQNFIALPTLDGKLVLINPRNPATPAAIPVGETKNYGNIIFAKAINNKIVLATPSNVLVVSPAGKKEYSAKIADITVKNGIIYLLTRDGKVEKLTTDLNVIASKKFAYADYATIAALNGKVYAYAKSGSLVVMDDNLQKYKVYSIGSAKDYSFVSGNYLYIDDKKVDLSALGYE